MSATSAPRAATLDELLCFDLYAASRAITACYRPVLDELGLTYPQYLVVRLLSDGEVRPVSAIADQLQLDHGTLTPLLRRMERAGFITRSRSTRDERVVEVALTEGGREVTRHFDRLDCHVRDALGLTVEETHDLQSRLRALLP